MIAVASSLSRIVHNIATKVRVRINIECVQMRIIKREKYNPLIWKMEINGKCFFR